jgi:hypothetical protein
VCAARQSTLLEFSVAASSQPLFSHPWMVAMQRVLPGRAEVVYLDESNNLFRGWRVFFVGPWSIPPSVCCDYVRRKLGPSKFTRIALDMVYAIRWRCFRFHPIDSTSSSHLDTRTAQLPVSCHSQDQIPSVRMLSLSSCYYWSRRHAQVPLRVGNIPQIPGQIKNVAIPPATCTRPRKGLRKW